MNDGVEELSEENRPLDHLLKIALLLLTRQELSCSTAGNASEKGTTEALKDTSGELEARIEFTVRKRYMRSGVQHILEGNTDR